MTKKTKLELTWPGKEERPRLEPRILIEDPAKSYHAKVRREGDIFDNMLIKGDNLLALKALEQDYAGKVKCVFIDPPYNTGSAFEHYDDGLEHSLWLSLIRDRLEIIKRLLSDQGSLWITIDDNEAHYLKVICDEVFGRVNFVTDITWHKRISPANDAKYFSADADHILVYARSKEAWSPNRSARTEAQSAYYKNLDDDPRGPWNSSAYTCAKSAEERPNLYYPIVNPNTNKEIWPSKTRVWAYGPETHARNVADNLVYWGKDGRGTMPRIKKFLSETKLVVPRSIWGHDEAGHNQESKIEIERLFPGNPFGTPKPERLLKKVVEISTRPGDLVLDSFAGSGTTGAVAHKMGRRWIMVEIGEHAETHVLPRLQKVIDGTDQGGISKAVDWKGGGGFRYFALAPSLLEQDRYGNWVIAKDYNPAMLAEAMCKHMGFTYAPASDPQEYWRHGSSTETDFIYVTTQALTHEACTKISHDVGPDRSLLICCKAFDADADAFDNLTLVKIPTSILQKCEWGRDDYSLNIQNLPEADDAAEEIQAMTIGLPLFAGEAGDE
ncbi:MULTISPECIES: site-specific DNA-methyltransferase [unclassified Novosphingobium]|uniref:site-specific DNA-methyltransferase n=1 Tax=unclassified Novosphingobium TaxID=2644732 RepID=UPI000D308F45|nr:MULTISPECIES: site-specific DNA-methyltransferase [unclassified Novosphingobium]PTR05736.1 adenine-specific DNA-methyltransferase [Novosphingobium sp. GV055]PUA94338.1 adenine-specific DNA-methyltransferase [Novosphingobium sp. GV061]PUB12486.1 adenine-specific DNA-methyltransferase [Novosphingobium sp. GV079]PUB37278.1 adenine-specific DNA-methyltransferase [Novosphingobium sp. GV027]